MDNLDSTAHILSRLSGMNIVRFSQVCAITRNLVARIFIFPVYPLNLKRLKGAARKNNLPALLFAPQVYGLYELLVAAAQAGSVEFGILLLRKFAIGKDILEFIQKPRAGLLYILRRYYRLQHRQELTDHFLRSRDVDILRRESPEHLRDILAHCDSQFHPTLHLLLQDQNADTYPLEAKPELVARCCRGLHCSGECVSVIESVVSHTSCDFHRLAENALISECPHACLLICRLSPALITYMIKHSMCASTQVVARALFAEYHSYLASIGGIDQCRVSVMEVFYTYSLPNDAVGGAILIKSARGTAELFQHCLAQISEPDWDKILRSSIRSKDSRVFAQALVATSGHNRPWLLREILRHGSSAVLRYAVEHIPGEYPNGYTESFLAGGKRKHLRYLLLHTDLIKLSFLGFSQTKCYKLAEIELIIGPE